MCNALHLAQVHGQQRLGAVLGLDLGILVDSEHYCRVGRVQVKADNDYALFHKERIGVINRNKRRHQATT